MKTFLPRTTAGRTTRAPALALIISTFLGCATTQSKQGQIEVGNQYAKDGLLREASEAYKKALVANPRHPTAHRNLGMVLVKLGDYQGAVRHLEKAMSRYEKDFDANYYLGEAYRALEKFAEAIFRYRRALDFKAGDTRALKSLAWSYFKIRYYSEALNIARELQKVANDDEQVPIIVARTLLKMKRPKEALTIVRMPRNLARGSRPFYSSVEGDILFELNDDTGAMKAYREALKDQPLLASALLGLGRCLLNQGKTSPAITYMERAVRIKPRLTEGHYLLAKAYEATNKEKSIRYYSFFLRQAAADPDYVGFIPDVKQRLGALRGSNPSAGAIPKIAAPETNGTAVTR